MVTNGKQKKMNNTTKENDIKIELACGDNNKSYILLAYLKTLFAQKELQEEFLNARTISACTDLHGEPYCTPNFVGTLFGKLKIHSKLVDGITKWSMINLKDLVEIATLVKCSKSNFESKINQDKADFFGWSNKGKKLNGVYVNNSFLYSLS